MTQQGNSIHPGNIQHFADSAKNAIQLGQRQFFTPPDLAASLCSVFRRNASTIATDLMVGSGSLLAASKRQHLTGIDVDSRVSDPDSGLLSSVSKSSVFQADVTRFYPLAKSASLSFDLLLLNPPFSLQWYLDRLSLLAASTVPGVAKAYAAALAAGDTIDSTLGTFLIALDTLSHSGEGMMICNAATARRFIGDPEADSSLQTENLKLETSLLRNVWCWLEIPGAIYENQHTAFTTAVLYFSASHGRACPADRLPLFLHSPSPDPGTVERTLATAISARSFAFCGRSIDHDFQAQKWKEDFHPLWNAVRGEYHALYHGAPPAYNLMLGADGRILTHLDPFRKAAYVHNRDLLTAFRSMHGEAPASLVVQQASRSALRHALASGNWRVQPELIAAVDRAIADYESIRAPFYTPNPVQALGWLDEESELPCCSSGIPGFRPGVNYPIKTWIENTSWSDRKRNLAGEYEDLTLSGRELVVELLADDDRRHHFHVRRDDSEQIKDSETTHHHHIQALLDHFTIPIPRDVAHANPAAYTENLSRLDTLESLINAA